MPTVWLTPSAAKTYDELSMYVESLCPLDSEYIEQEVKRITNLIASNPGHQELRRWKILRSGREIFVEVIKTSSYVEHDVAIVWALLPDGSAAVINYQLQYLRVQS